MPEHSPRKLSPSRVKRGSSSFVYLTIVAVVLLLLLGGYFYLYKDSSWPYSKRGELSFTGRGGTRPDTGPLIQGDQTGQRSTPSQGHSPATQKEQNSPVENETRPDSPISSAISDHQVGGDDRTDPLSGEYQHLVDELNNFYDHLDHQPYMQAFNLKDPSKVHFSRLIQKLADNPPVVTRETDDLFTLLKNTAHFFRILGKDNIVILKGILDREKDSLEDILKTFYTLTLHPEYLQKEYALSIPFESLYDYAGFFLNTMGGRLYLFRRDSTSRMAVSYYAILVVDQANSKGTGHHGINLKPAVDFLIEEIETGGNRLRMKDQYLDTLYDLKEKYN